MYKYKTFLIILAILFSSCSSTQLSKTGRPIISMKKSNLIRSKNLDRCIDKVFSENPIYYKEKINLEEQYRIRFYEHARNISKKVIALSRLRDSNSRLMGEEVSTISKTVLPIHEAGIYEITQLDMMYLHGELRMTALFTLRTLIIMVWY